MVAVHSLFESHLTVANLDRSVAFYRDALGLELATVIEARRVAFFWIGAPGRSMLGLWESGTGPQRMSLHIAFTAELEDVLQSPARLKQLGIEPLDLDGNPATEAVVLGWMPAASIYFRDPDGHMLEYIAMLGVPARPDLGVLSWSAWRTATAEESAVGIRG